MNVVYEHKNGDPGNISWKGAKTMIQVSEKVTDCWVTGTEWHRYGSQILRERSLCTF